MEQEEEEVELFVLLPRYSLCVLLNDDFSLRVKVTFGFGFFGAFL